MGRNLKRQSKLCAAASAAALLTGGCRARVPGPHMVVEASRRDLGGIDAGGSRETAFRLRNEGSAPLQILGADDPCGCLSPKYPPTLSSGASGEIRVTFQPQPLWSGKMEQYVLLRTNDPRQPEARLVVAADVQPYVRMEPPSPVVIPYRPGQTLRREVRLTPRSGSSLTLSRPVSDSSLVKAALDPPASTDPGHAYRLRLTVGPLRGGGDLTAAVRLATSEPRVPQVPVLVTCLAQVGPIVNPKQVTLPLLGRDAAKEKKEIARLQVFARNGILHLQGVETGNPGLKAETVTRSAGHFYEVVLRYTGGWKSGPVKSAIRIRTDDRNQPVLTVPFQATIR